MADEPTDPFSLMDHLEKCHSIHPAILEQWDADELRYFHRRVHEVNDA